jgi:hypothetical protein
MSGTDLSSMAQQLRDFASRRDWDQFHSHAIPGRGLCKTRPYSCLRQKQGRNSASSLRPLPPGFDACLTLPLQADHVARRSG